MKVSETQLPGVLLLEPRVFSDERGYFLEGWSDERYRNAGIRRMFVQDNVSVSQRGVLRGLHFQEPRPQGKLVSVLRGEVWDVVVDVRRGSPSFGQWLGFHLSAENARQLWIPEGYAHGFEVLSDDALFSYKCTDVYTPSAERTLRWDDPDLAIDWPICSPLISEKDAHGLCLRDFPADWLPRYTAIAEVR